MHLIPNKPNFIHNSPCSNLLVCCRGVAAGEYLIWFILLRYVYAKEMLIFFFAFLYFYIRNIVTFSCSCFSLSLLLIPFLSPRPGYVKEFHSISCLSVSSLSFSLDDQHLLALLLLRFILVLFSNLETWSSIHKTVYQLHCTHCHQPAETAAAAVEGK